MIAVAVPEAEPVQRRHMEETDVAKLQRSAMRVGPMTAIVVDLLLNSGIRASEAAELELKNILRETDGRCRIKVTGKRGKTRSILLNKGISARLAAWTRIQDRRAHLHVFPSPHNPTDHVKRHCIWSHVKRAARGAGLPDVSPHWLRHAFASRALDNKAPLHVVRQDLGHASLATTSLYVTCQDGASSSSFLGGRSGGAD